MLEKYTIMVPDINERSVAEILAQLYEIEYVCEQILIENEDLKDNAKKDMPIIDLKIASNGGLLTGALSIISAVEKLKRMGCFVITECCSHAFSAGFFIFLSGDLRLAPYPKFAKLLYHYALTGCPMENVNVQIDNLQLVREDMELLKEYVVEKTNITMEELNKWDRVDWWIRYDEAKELGIIKETIDEPKEEVVVDELTDEELAIIKEELTLLSKDNEEVMKVVKDIAGESEKEIEKDKEEPKKKSKKRPTRVKKVDAGEDDKENKGE